MNPERKPITKEQLERVRKGMIHPTTSLAGKIEYAYRRDMEQGYRTPTKLRLSAENAALLLAELDPVAAEINSFMGMTVVIDNDADYIILEGDKIAGVDFQP